MLSYEQNMQILWICAIVITDVIVAGIISKRKNRSMAKWFIASLILGPFIALLVSSFFEKLPQTDPSKVKFCESDNTYFPKKDSDFYNAKRMSVVKNEIIKHIQATEAFAKDVDSKNKSDAVFGVLLGAMDAFVMSINSSQSKSEYNTIYAKQSDDFLSAVYATEYNMLDVRYSFLRDFKEDFASFDFENGCDLETLSSAIAKYTVKALEDLGASVNFETIKDLLVSVSPESALVSAGN